MLQTPFLVIGILAVAALGVLAPHLFTRFRLTWAIQRGLAQEQRNSRVDVDLSRVAAYHNGLGGRASADTVDDATWNDLDLDAVFLAVDRTASQVGRQCLYHLLRQPRFTVEPLERLEAATKRFTTAPADAARVRRVLKPLADPRSGYLSDLMYGELPARPALWWAFPLLTAISCLCLALLAIWPKVLVVWLVVCMTNIVIQLAYRPRVRRLVVAFQSVPAFVRAAEQLSRLSPAGIEHEIAMLRTDAPQLASLRRATTWLLFEPGSASEPWSTIYEYVNLLFLLDINAFVFSIQRAADARALLRRVFEAVGQVDTAQSLAEWRQTLSHWTVPEYSTPGKELHTTEVFHPLLAQPVANTLRVRDASILITGSNMAGKTTFMRTLGVNAILAQTLHTVCAHTWQAPLLHVRSSIARTDSLLEGRSHYLAEVESVHSLLRAKQPGRQHLFLLDEMFRGTNTAERVAAAYAVLAYLTQGIDVVVVATHDLELVALLGDSYESYHFRERIAEDTLSFDYRLREGVSSTRNAIALLQLQQYPDEIIANAMAVLNRAQALDTQDT
ncbi:MAG: hypothetical protein JWO05_1052 [Gemmatimonadetes bacterium]|nr:hypothetical protein [Gemmatimonadota bacterium]